MARRTVGPRRSDSVRTYVRSTRIIGGLSVLLLSGAVVWDLTNDRFWSRHALFTSLVASLIVVAVTAAVLNEVLERRQRERWAVLAQYALFDLVRTARLVWTGLLELAGLAPDGELEDGALAAGSAAVLDTPRLTAAIDDRLLIGSDFTEGFCGPGEAFCELAVNLQEGSICRHFPPNTFAEGAPRKHYANVMRSERKTQFSIRE
jgi:hypothetical protein